MSLHGLVICYAVVDTTEVIESAIHLMPSDASLALLANHSQVLSRSPASGAEQPESLLCGGTGQAGGYQ